MVVLLQDAAESISPATRSCATSPGSSVRCRQGTDTPIRYETASRPEFEYRSTGHPRRRAPEVDGLGLARPGRLARQASGGGPWVPLLPGRGAPALHPGPSGSGSGARPPPGYPEPTHISSIFRLLKYLDRFGADQLFRMVIFTNR